MGLIALLSASEPVADDERDLRACLPVAGCTVLERQAGLALEAGARQIFVAVSTMPVPLMRALDRMNQGGARVRPIRHIDELLDAMGDDDRLLLFADAMLVPAATVRRLAGMPGSAVLTVEDGPLSAELERVSAQMRWGGVAVTTSAVARQAAELPDDWDPLSTLLRCAVQAQARPVPAEKRALEQGEIALVATPMLADAAEARLVQAANANGIGTGRRLLFSPLARLLGAPLLKRKASALMALVPALLLFGGAATAMVSGRPILGAAGGLLGALVAAIAEFLRQFNNAQPVSRIGGHLARWMAALLPLALTTGVLLGTGETRLGWILPLAAAAALPFFWSTQALIAASRDGEGQWQDALLHDPEAFLLLALAGAATGQPLIALAASVALTAIGLLGWTALSLRATPTV